MVPDFFIPFQGWPRVRYALVSTDIEETFFVSCLMWVPMGDNFSVALAQEIALESLQRSKLGRPPPLDIIFGATLRPGIGFQLPYIDDKKFIGTSAIDVNEETKNISAVLYSFALPVAPETNVFASGKVASEGLGLWFWTHGVLTVMPDMSVRFLRLRCTS